MKLLLLAFGANSKSEYEFCLGLMRLKLGNGLKRLDSELFVCVHRVDRGRQWGTRRGGTVPEPEWGGPD